MTLSHYWSCQHKTSFWKVAQTQGRSCEQHQRRRHGARATRVSFKMTALLLVTFSCRTLAFNAESQKHIVCVYTSQHGGGKQQTRHAMPFIVFLQDIVYYSTRLSMGRHSADKIGPTQLGSFHHRGSSVIPAQPTDPQHTLIQCTACDNFLQRRTRSG